MPKENFKDKINSAGFDKNPENINKNGQPRKTVNAVNLEMEAQGYTEATKQDILSCYLRLVNLTMPELEKKVTDKDQPALVRIVGKAILSGKGFDVIEKMLDRGIGRPTEHAITKHEGEVTIVIDQDDAKL